MAICIMQMSSMKRFRLQNLVKDEILVIKRNLTILNDKQDIKQSV